MKDESAVVNKNGKDLRGYTWVFVSFALMDTDFLPG
jgi:hypothetical protein